MSGEYRFSIFFPIIVITIGYVLDCTAQRSLSHTAFSLRVFSQEVIGSIAISTFDFSTVFSAWSRHIYNQHETESSSSSYVFSCLVTEKLTCIAPGQFKHTNTAKCETTFRAWKFLSACSNKRAAYSTL